MSGVLLSLAVVLSSASAVVPDEAPAAPGITLGSHAGKRSASILGGVELAGTWTTSKSAPLRVTDDLRLGLAETPLPLDVGGGVGRDVRQILALILGFIPGFGLGHLVAGDKDGFVLFLVIDVALYVGWVVLGSLFHGIFWGLPGVVWLVVHVIQALDAYGEAGGGRIVQLTREKAVQIAGVERPSLQPVTTTRLFSFQF